MGDFLWIKYALERLGYYDISESKVNDTDVVKALGKLRNIYVVSDGTDISVFPKYNHRGDFEVWSYKITENNIIEWKQLTPS